MTCPTCTPAKRCDSCERVAILDAIDFTEPGAAVHAIEALDAHDRARLEGAETRIAKAIYREYSRRAKPGAYVSWDELVRIGGAEPFMGDARAALAAITEAK